MRLSGFTGIDSASLPGILPPKAFDVTDPSLSDFRVDKNKTRSDMLGGVFDLEEQREKACT